jgi:AraC family transcriptional regulator
MNLVEFRSGNMPAPAGESRSNADAVAQVIRQMKRPVNGTVTLDEWADYALMGKFELIAAFKRLTGIPPKAFHNAEKLEIAKRLLVFESMSVTDACFEIGFESVGSFVSKFSQCVGIPPGNYAREMSAIGFAKAFGAAILGGWPPARTPGQDRTLVFEWPAGWDRRCLIAALCQRPYPSGMPATWRFVPPTSGRAVVDANFDGYCLVASMPVIPRLAELVNFRPALIGRERLAGDRQEIRVRLRAPSIFDPPVTLAVPALFCRETKAG